MKALVFTIIFNIIQETKPAIFIQKCDNRYLISCNFKGVPDNSKIHLVSIEGDTLQTKNIIDGKCVFEGQLKENNMLCQIAFDPYISYLPSRPIFLTTEAISIVGSVNSTNIDIAVNGSRADKELTQFTRYINHSRNNFLSTKSKMQELKSKNAKTSEIIAASSSLDSMKKVYHTAAAEWINNNLSSEALPLIVLNLANEIGPTLLKEEYARMNPNQKESYYGRKIHTAISNAEIYTKFKIGHTIPNLILVDTSGTEVSLHDIVKKNKFTLLDIWASWCVPCRVVIPELNDTREIFVDKGFSIIGISIDKSKDKWKSALKVDKPKWDQFTTIQQSDRFITEFGLTLIPAYILLDQDCRMLSLECDNCNVSSFGDPINPKRLTGTLTKLFE